MPGGVYTAGMTQRMLPLLLLLLAGTLRSGEGPAGVRWREWDRAAFEEAAARELPIALAISCSWAQAAQALERRTLQDASLIRRLNEHFIPVRVDRDRRPDIDVRYQSAVRALSKASGWPLVAFLTPEGWVLLGGTFSRLEDDYLREQPGLQTVTEHVAESWAKRRRELTVKAEEFEKQLRADDPELAGEVPSGLLARVAEAVRALLVPPPQWEGPRFPQPCAVELLLVHYRRTGSAESLAAARTYLDGMLDGAVYDRLHGGFHRFGLDRDWRMPRLEKLLAVNAEMLRVLALAFRATREARYREAAERTLEWTLTTLADRDRGGFFASQAACVTPEDPGEYYTWTVGEVERALKDPTQCRFFSTVHGIGEWGDLPETAPHRNLLFVSVDPAEACRSLRLEAAAGSVLLADARMKLIAATRERRAPPVDDILLVDANARAVSALLACASAFDHSAAKACALRTLDRLLAECVEARRGTAHAVPRGGKPEFACLANDEAALAVACLDAADATGLQAYEAAARASVERLARFRDPRTGACLDRWADEEAAPPALGRLGEPVRPITDTPGPSTNALAAQAHLRWGRRAKDDKPIERARETIRAFGAVLERLGPSSAALVIVADEANGSQP